MFDRCIFDSVHTRQDKTVDGLQDTILWLQMGALCVCVCRGGGGGLHISRPVRERREYTLGRKESQTFVGGD